MQLLAVPQEAHASKQLHLIEHATTSMRAFMSSVPDFQIMTSGEQCSLLERNWHVLSGLNFIFVLRDSGLYGCSKFTSDAARVYGNAVVSGAGRLRARLELDSTLVKLMFVVHAFSSSSLIMEVPRIKKYDSLTLGTFRLLGSQNVFVELIWKYMMYRYGHRETVLRFASLVKQMLDTIKHVTLLYVTNDSHHEFVDKTFDDSKLSLSIKQSAAVPLWGNH